MKGSPVPCVMISHLYLYTAQSQLSRTIEHQMKCVKGADCTGITLTIRKRSVGSDKNGCKPITKADIVFVVDQSSSVGKEGWKKQLDFLQQTVAGLPIGKDSVRVGLIKFSTEAECMFKIGTHADSAGLEKAIAGLSFEGGITNTHLALQKAQEQLLKDASGNQKVVIVLTDGASNEKEETAGKAKVIKEKGAKVIAIGVGNTDKAELAKIASKENFVLHTDNMDALVKGDFMKEKVLDSINCIMDGEEADLFI